jgi:hypothetical protein
MRYALIAVILTALAVFLVSEAGPGKVAAPDPEYQVQNLSVQDIGLDDGSGLQLKWEPLPKEKHVIEYRIYRGVSPDSLFMIGSIPVSAKLGVVSKELFYFDKDYNEFVTVTSPGSLDHEKSQAKGSPLYKHMPKVTEIYAQILKRYRPLAIIAKNEFYFHAKEITKVTPGKDKSAPADTTIYAGLKLHQFEAILAKLKAGQKYYYAITTVDNRGHVHTPCATVYGEPIDNAPDVVTPFHAVLVDGVSDKPVGLQFEWEPQLFKDDIAYHSIYALKASDSTAFAAYQEYLKKHNVWMEANSLRPDNPLPDSIPPVPNPCKLVWRSMTSYPYDTPNFIKLDLKDGRYVDPNYSIYYNYDSALNERFLFSLQDYSGFETFSAPVAPKVTLAKNLPELPDYEVIDAPNDQGEYMQVNFGRPLAYVTKTQFSNNHKTLIINYDFAVNEHYTIRNIYFEFSCKGRTVAKVNEYFLDHIVRAKFPGIDLKTDTLDVKITFRTGKNQVEDDYILTQKLSFDPESLQLTPSEVFFQNEAIDQYRYYVVKSCKNVAEQRLAKRVGPLFRYYNDNIAYETSIFSGIDSYDAKQKLLYISPQTDLQYSPLDSTSIITSIFPDAAQRDLRAYDKQVREMQDSLAKVTDPAQKEAMEAQIKSMEKFVAAQRNSPMVKELAAQKDLKHRNKLLRKLREEGLRTFNFRFAKSDGEGNFTISDVYTNNGQQYFTPKSEYFDKTSIPMLIASLLFGLFVVIMLSRARSGANLYVRPISGLSEVDNAIGRATEMGRPILYVPGLSSIDDPATLSSLAILGHVARRVATYDTRLIVPNCDFIVFPIAQEIVRSAYYEAGRPDAFNSQDVFIIATGQFPYVASVNGVMIREKSATNFYMGMFYAEALIMTETGSSTGAIQIAGTDAITQIPFFITTCDFTLIGEELYAASAYLSREPMILGTLKAQDAAKFMIIAFVIIGAILSTAHITFLVNAFPEK